MGGDTTPSSAVVQTAGHGYGLPGRPLKMRFGALARENLCISNTLT